MTDRRVATYVFKKVGDCEIRADVYTDGGAGPKPGIIWLHGGALMFGDRGMLHPAQAERYVSAGYVVVAVDYRLAPETKLPEILTDIQDAIAWAREDGSRLFELDPRRMAVVGHSAGGFLTLLAGLYVEPRPQALVTFYGYGDIVGPWYSEPSPFYCQQPLVSEAEARAVVGATEISQGPWRGSIDGGSQPDRSRFYLYCRQQGTWPQMATGLDLHQEMPAVLRFCPERHVGADHPPTLLLHGDEDTDVPYERSVVMARALATHGVLHQLLTVPAGGHGFDARMDDPRVTAMFDQVLAFLARHV
jgi:acetyl esterase/lipase